MKVLLKQDPVCGMDVDPSHAGDETQYGGETYYFCSRDCKDQFEHTPLAFIGERPGAPLSHYSNPTTPRAYGKGHSGRNRGLSKARAREPGGRQTR